MSMKDARRMLTISGLVLALSSPLLAADKKATIKVYGMSCPMCANGVAGSLKQLKGVESTEVSLKKAEVVVVYNDKEVTVAELKKQIKKSGFSIKPKAK
ncbi:MAG: cation transporter [Acidobacteria bacterium]|nr:cation transporter [Acidobacteriota bacterium]